ncbi:MAG: HNH endonuclease family protein [Kineosporiaceae bacterium]
MALVAGGTVLVLRDDGAVARLRAAGGALAGEVSDAAAGALDGPQPAPGASGTGETNPGRSLGGLEPGLTPEQAEAAVAALTVEPETLPGTGDYDRDDYGERWQDVDGNGCNQRDDVLLRDARPGTAVVEEQGDCPHDVVAGSWDDPYTGAVLAFDDLKDPDQAQAISIDHVVPLAEAHRSGASEWPAAQRAEFANDLDGLVAADGSVNSDKGDSDPARWRPPDDAAWCDYALVWVTVKDQWSLAVDAREAAALRDMLARC